MGWVFLRDPESGAPHLVSEGGAGLFEARGWQRYAMPEGLDPNDPYAPAALHEVLALAPEPEPILSEGEALALKGQALDEALDRAGLSKAGSADEKRARIAEHEAELAATTEEEGSQ